MKILHCLNSPHIGGIERLVTELALEQRREGMDVSIMLDTQKGQYYEYLLEQDIPILFSGIIGGFDVRYATYKKLKNVFSKFQITHLHSFSPIRSIAAKASNAKVVYTIHGLSKGIRNENKIKTLVREYVKKRCLNRVDFLIANSVYTLNLAINHYGLKLTAKQAILNGIKLTKSSSTHPKLMQPFKIGLISRFTPRKRIDRLVKAYKLFLDEGGKGRLVLVGDGETFKSINELITKLKIECNVDLVGYQANVEDYYKTFDVCVFPSQFEPFGLVAVESYLFGKPVLAFENSGGLKEVISPLEPDNILETEEELAKRLILLSNQREQTDEKSNKRIIYAQDNFSIGRMEKQYFNVYKKLI